jgi:hypothetical protein
MNCAKAYQKTVKHKTMNDDQYNFICFPFQFLTKRFYNFQNLYHGEYKCYDPKMYQVQGNYLEFLKIFENITFRHIFTPEHIASLIELGIPVDSNLVIIEETKVCVHQELGSIAFHILANKLKNGIEKLIELIEKINSEHPKYFKTDENGNIYSMKTYRYDEFIVEFQNLTDYKYVKNLFYDSKSGVITLSLENEIEFKVYKMKRIIERLNIFNFNNIPL